MVVADVVEVVDAVDVKLIAVNAPDVVEVELGVVVVVVGSEVVVLDEVPIDEFRYAVHRPYMLSPLAIPAATPLLIPFWAPELVPVDAVVVVDDEVCFGKVTLVEMLELGIVIPTFESEPESVDCIEVGRSP